MKLEIKHRKKNGKSTNTWRLNNMLLKNQWVNNEISEDSRKYLETNENENNLTKSMGCSKSSSKREVHSNTRLPQETRKISNKQPNLLSKIIRKRRTKKTQSRRRKEMIKIREEVNKKEEKNKNHKFSFYNSQP